MVVVTSRAPANIAPSQYNFPSAETRVERAGVLSLTAIRPAPKPVEPPRKHIPAVFLAMPDPSWQRPVRAMDELNAQRLRHDGLDWQTGCLAVAIYYEARAESELGQIAVAQVIMNRVRSRAYPDTICGVVYQNAHMRNRCQFSFTCDGKPDDPRHVRAWTTSKVLAQRINCGSDCNYRPKQIRPLKRLHKAIQRSTHYHATYVRPKWRRKLERAGKIGQHIFYISARVWSF